MSRFGSLIFQIPDIGIKQLFFQIGIRAIHFNGRKVMTKYSTVSAGVDGLCICMVLFFCLL